MKFTISTGIDLNAMFEIREMVARELPEDVPSGALLRAGAPIGFDWCA